MPLPTGLVATVLIALAALFGGRLCLAEEFEGVGLHPKQDAAGVPISAAVNLRFSAPVNPETLSHLTVHRISVDKVESIPIGVATDLTNASITLAPRDFLVPNSRYEIRGIARVRSRDGQPLKPFRSRFTTGSKPADAGAGLVFSQQRFDTTRSMTTVLFGPDRRLYAADAFGHLVRWDIDGDGAPRNRTVLLSDPRKSRQYIDLEWDPEATADRLILWASFAERLAPRGDRRYFTGTIVRLELGDRIRERVVVTGLPHGREKQGGFDTLPASTQRTRVSRGTALPIGGLDVE